ncbi:uncharacterized protein VTP21DRAFT_1365 [Calcarisporiella thermophila]|uniref:uncharacterized protein n=1 Tax=Calcarisporiella thermophila TaxID=911321 RepID=UPI0037423FD2
MSQKETIVNSDDAIKVVHELRERGYLPIENYGIIGNLRTCALVGNGSVDFFCYPKFDSPSLFARLLDKNKGGHFYIAPTDETRIKQQYLPNSNILLTRYLSEKGGGHVMDYMHIPLRSQRLSSKPLQHWLIRHVQVNRGEFTFRVECFPAFNYARDPHETIIEPYTTTSICCNSFVGDQRTVFKSQGLVMDLRYFVRCGEGDKPHVELKLEDRSHLGHKGKGVVAEITLRETQEIIFIFREVPPTALNSNLKDEGRPQESTNREGEKEGLQDRIYHLAESQHSLRMVTNSDYVVDSRFGKPTLVPRQSTDPPLSSELIEALFRQTLGYWQEWIGRCRYTGRWRESVQRSALTLKLLAYEPTGAVVAAATFGLPEEIGGERNWDYRYVWLRDSAFTIYALLRLGLTDEANAYMNFIEKRCAESNDGSLQIMYGIEGEHELTEVVLDHLEGYRGSRPVRIGNGAYDHLQLDIYGELLDGIYLYNKWGTPISYQIWTYIRRIVNYVCDNWKRKDMSIWEVRGMQQNFIYSKVLCWVAVDRGIRLSEKRTLPCPDRFRWMAVRDEIFEEVMTIGWNPKLGIFSQSYESRDAVDASVLIMPLVFFLSPSDPRFLSTVEQIMKPPEKGGLLVNNLVFRYNVLTTDDGLSGEEGSFSMCTFWLVEALTRAGKYDRKLLSQALLIFEQMMGYATPLGLFSEEVARSGELLGNMPQAFTHISHISAAFHLDRVLSNKE